jgi:hypothetical protein
MELKKVLWLEDQFEDLRAYRSELFMADYLVDCVASVSETIEKLRTEEYVASIFDIKVIPGEFREWIELDKRKRKEKPDFDPNLGFELLKSIFTPENAEIKLEPPLKLNPWKVIVLSVVFTNTDDIEAMGIPVDQIIYKANIALDTIPRLIEKIEKRNKDI